jgi:DNA-binding NarL/FixJ family response regulator
MNKRILIVDDHYVVRTGTAAVLRSAYPNLTIDFSEKYEDVKESLRTHHYDLIFLDIDMPGTKYTEMISELKDIQQNVKILIFSAYDQNVALQYIHKGAEGYLNKQGTEDDIKNAVKTILDTGFYYASELIPLIIKDAKEIKSIKKLTPREYQVFELLAKGNGNLEISNLLGIQINTISTFKKKIFEKIGTNNIIELAKVYQNLH